MIELYNKGGLLIIPLLLCSVFAVIIIIDRILFILRTRTDSESFFLRVRELIEKGKKDMAVYLCDKNNTPVSRIVKEALELSEDSTEDIRKGMDIAIMREVPKFERFLTSLGTIAYISPLLGLLGTVTGMIKCFAAIASEGVGHPEFIASGISEALTTTVVGLCIAIPTLAFYNFIITRVDNFILQLEADSYSLIKVLKKKKIQ